MIALLAIELLLGAALAVQIWYAFAITRRGTEVGRATKVVWAVNMVLLSSLMLGLGWVFWSLSSAGEL